MKDKLAEEIIEKKLKGAVSYGAKDGIDGRQLVINAMQAYHEAANKQITEDDFEAWASEQDFGYGANYYLMKAGAKMGVRALKDGEIKHIEK